MKKLTLLVAALAFPAFVMGDGEDKKGHKEDAKDHVLKAICVVTPLSKSKVHGVLHFTQKGHTVLLKGEIVGLTPGKHAFHVHEFGDLTSKDGMSTGGHFNPDKKPHGAQHDKDRHVGDLGNITANEDGKAVVNIKDTIISLHGKHSIIGRAIIIHDKEDDFSQPVGNAGGRIGGGIIGIAK
jgi:Cu-Zn family superoxide dismutase